MESEVLLQTRRSVDRTYRTVHEEYLNRKTTYEDGQKNAGILRIAIREDLMALAELFGPDMPQLHRTSAQSLPDRPDFEDNLHEDMLSTLRSTRQLRPSQTIRMGPEHRRQNGRNEICASSLGSASSRARIPF
jgi:hypothetical protein